MNIRKNGEGRTILLVGGAGYVGTVLTRCLLDQGYGVRVLDSLIYGHGHAIRQFLNDPAYTFIHADLRDEASLSSALDGVNGVVLLAGLVGDPICKKYPELARSINLDGCVQVYEMAQDRKIERFVFASTCSNYGLRETDDLATEEADLNPVSLYAECKVGVEKHILASPPSVETCATILRVATAYGFSQRMRFDLTISEFTRELARGDDLLVYDEDTWRPYCHVVDLSRAVIMALEAERKKVDREVFNVGNDDENFTKRMLVEIIEGTVGTGLAKYKVGGVDPRNYRVSFKKIQRVLGFRNLHNVHTEIPALVDAVRNGLFKEVGDDPNYYGNQEIAGAAE